ncbi:MAG TPA: mechanosensitive ion channel protein MscS [Clostridium sp.]|nr:mechanosensitive ion channel family protein [Clostridia bacterium]HCW05372.1 mechanosensitive ion channel protein MscS [Clostridium sp.]
MIEMIKGIFMDYGANEGMAQVLSNVIAVITIIAISLVADKAIQKILLRYVRLYVEKTKFKWDDVFLEKKVFESIAHIVPFAIIHVSASIFPAYQVLIQKIAFTCIVIIILPTVSKTLDAINEIYSSFEISKVRPIKGYLQVISIIIYIVGAIITISVLIDRSPLILLSGIGAATAVLMLIFQNSILGLVSSIQLTSNNMLQIGDWIEMPKYGADGDVLEISLHTVKVQNFDKTITTIPTYAMISESFRNWRGMKESGARRIKRAINIDITSIKFCNEELLERLEKNPYLKEYLRSKKEELANYNKEYREKNNTSGEGRRLTNIGVFRVYVENYLKNNPNISDNMTRIVRQLPPTETGLPLEIYAFINKIVWKDYESIQADIFDHILAIVPEFDLRVYQEPSSYDFNINYISNQ